MADGERGVEIGGNSSQSIIITGDNNIVNHGFPSPATTSKIWNVPHARNSFFTGREDILTQLQATLTGAKSAASTQTQAINGLGGIGKTQTAVEYAYRSQQYYQAVLWAEADTETILTTEFARIATLLALPEAQAQDLDQIREAVKRWLTETTDYLLILDNADDPAYLKQFLPSNPAGHVLLTSRARNLAMLHIDSPLNLPVLSSEDAVAFLFHRTGRKADEAAERVAATELAEELDGLPLALEQAAAYIAVNQSRFHDYLMSYRKRAVTLLEKQAPETGGYEKTVAVTWSINFEAVAAASEASADLLRVSAFLAPNRIPEELLVAGAPLLGQTLADALAGAEEDRLLLDELLEPLARYSLILRDVGARTYDIHRLVQAVIQHGMDEDVRREYATLTVRAVNRAFPDVDLSTWHLCERLLPHVRVCTQHTRDQTSGFQEAMRLLNQVSFYLHRRALYVEAEAFSKEALSAREQALGPEHPDVALSLNNLAQLHRAQGKYATAVSLSERALAIRENVQGPMHPLTALGLDNLAGIYYAQGNYKEVEMLLKRALSIREQVLGSEHPETAGNLNNLAGFYHSQGDHKAAEPLFQKALAISEKVHGPAHPATAGILNNLASLYQDQGNHRDAEALVNRSLAINEATNGKEHPDTALSFNNLGQLYQAQGKYEDAKHLYEQMLAINKKALGLEHPNTAISLNNLASIYDNQGNYEAAEPLYQQALGIRERTLGPEHTDVAQSLNNLALLYQAQGRYTDAEPLSKRAVMINEKTMGTAHPDTASSLNNLALLYQARGRYADAEPLLRRALLIRKQALGNEHPHTALSLNNLATLYHAQGKYADAEPLLKQALAMRELVLGPEHPDVAQSLNNLAGLYYAQGNYKAATPLLKQSLTIYKNALGLEHPDTIATRRNYTENQRKINPQGKFW